MKIISEDNINELNKLPNPTFILKINLNEIYNYYEEYEINNSFISNDNAKVIIILYYKKNEDTFNVALKISKNKNNKIKTNYDIITYLSLALIEEINNKQINVKSLSYNKSMYEILKIANFQKIFSESTIKKEYISLKIFLKPCYTYTILTNYLFYNLENLCDKSNVSKLSKNLVNIIIQKKQLIKNDDNINSNSNKNIQNYNVDKIVTFLINWLNDEINIGEDISEIIKNIKWEYVSLPLLFEFLIKYSNHIVSNDLEFIFVNSLLKIISKLYGNITLLAKEIIHSLIISAKKLNYISIFCENKKIKKFNLYNLMNQKRNLLLEHSDIDIVEEQKNNNKLIKNNIINLQIEKINHNLCYINKNVLKKNININKKEENAIKRKMQLGNNNSPIETKSHNNNKNKINLSLINNSDICSINSFITSNNNYKINFKLNDKLKKDNSNNINNNKQKIIISNIIYRKNNSIKDNNMKNIKINTPNNLNKFCYTPKIKVKLDKFNVNNTLNNTINFNVKNIDKLVIKNKCDKIKNKRNYNQNNSEIKNKTYSHDGNSSINFKINQQKKDNSIENYNIKYDKQKNNISILRQLLKMNKKRKKQSILAIKRNLYIFNQSLNIKTKNSNKS